LAGKKLFEVVSVTEFDELNRAIGAGKNLVNSPKVKRQQRTVLQQFSRNRQLVDLAVEGPHTTGLRVTATRLTASWSSSWVP
jgi:hypothetical protein